MKNTRSWKKNNNKKWITEALDKKKSSSLKHNLKKTLVATLPFLGPSPQPWSKARVADPHHFNSDPDPDPHQSNGNLQPLVYRHSRGPFWASRDQESAPMWWEPATTGLQTLQGSILSLQDSIVSVHGPPLLCFEHLKLLNIDFNADNRIRIQLFTLIRIRIQFFTLIRIRIPLFTLIRIQLFTLIRIRIQLFTLIRIGIQLLKLMRIRIQLPKLMRIRIHLSKNNADPDPQPWSKAKMKFFLPPCHLVVPCPSPPPRCRLHRRCVKRRAGCDGDGGPPPVSFPPLPPAVCVVSAPASSTTPSPTRQRRTRTCREGSWRTKKCCGYENEIRLRDKWLKYF